MGETIDTSKQVPKKKRAPKTNHTNLTNLMQYLHQLEVYRRPRKFSPQQTKVTNHHDHEPLLGAYLLSQYCHGVPFGRSFSISMKKVCLASSMPYRGPSHTTLCGSLWSWLKPLSKHKSMHQNCYMQVLSTAT